MDLKNDRHTILLDTDGSEVDDGAPGSGWYIYNVGDGVARKLASGYCYLGLIAEVYDAELHAAYEALNHPTTRTDLRPAEIYLCIDNTSAADCLAIKLVNHRAAIATAKTQWN